MMPLPHNPPVETISAGTEPDALASLTQPHLVAMWPGGAAVAELPSGGTVTVGRSRRAALCIDHPSVSRDHAVFRSMSLASSGGGTAITVEDLSSTNGTTVAGRRSPGAAHGRDRPPGGHGRRRGHRRPCGGPSATCCRHPCRRRCAHGHERRRGSRPVVVVDDAMKPASIAWSPCSRAAPCRSSSPARPGRGRTSSPTRATRAPTARRRPPTASPARRCPGRCSRASCSIRTRGLHRRVVCAGAWPRGWPTGPVRRDRRAPAHHARPCCCASSRARGDARRPSRRTIDVRFVCATNRELRPPCIGQPSAGPHHQRDQPRHPASASAQGRDPAPGPHLRRRGLPRGRASPKAR